MKVYVVIEPHGYDAPEVIGVYKTKEEAQKDAVDNAKYWRIIRETKFKDK